MLSLYLSLMLPFEPRFRTFIINGYYTKSKRLQSLEFLFLIYLCIFGLALRFIKEQRGPNLVSPCLINLFILSF